LTEPDVICEIPDYRKIPNKEFDEALKQSDERAEIQKISYKMFLQNIERIRGKKLPSELPGFG
ncbi:uncharacterized protein METZ01_LOCUS269037, partial [marine metagenome]